MIRRAGLPRAALRPVRTLGTRRLAATVRHRLRIEMSVADNSNVSLMVDRNIEAGRGSKTAYVAQAESLTYEELRRQVNRMGHLLRNLGVRREQRVLLVLDDTTAFPICLLYTSDAADE